MDKIESYESFAGRTVFSWELFDQTWRAKPESQYGKVGDHDVPYVFGTLLHTDHLGPFRAPEYCRLLQLKSDVQDAQLGLSTKYADDLYGEPIATEPESSQPAEATYVESTWS